MTADEIIIKYLDELTFKIETFGSPPYNSVGHGILIGLNEARDLLLSYMVDEVTT